MYTVQYIARRYWRIRYERSSIGTKGVEHTHLCWDMFLLPTRRVLVAHEKATMMLGAMAITLLVDDKASNSHKEKRP
eukprot:scaffold4717_cov89-Skeletonema_marinoi.AAC.1